MIKVDLFSNRTHADKVQVKAVKNMGIALSGNP